MPPDDDRTIDGGPDASPPAAPATAAVPATAHRADEATRRSLRRWAIASGIGVVLVTGSVTLSYTPLFGARSIRVSGEERMGPRRVLKLAGVREGTNLLHLDEHVVEARLEGEPWILDATVTVDLPSTLKVRVVERTPVVVLVAGGRRELVSADGVVLGPASRGASLPEMAPEVGSRLDVRVLRATADAVAAMEAPLRSRVASVAAIDGELSMVVDGGVEVRYGSASDVAAKAQALAAILSFAEREGKVLLAVDVSAPGAPTARFEGSYQPATGPDPSAEVAERSDDVGQGRGTGSPSASASPTP